jgi:hypothetical protein
MLPCNQAQKTRAAEATLVKVGVRRVPKRVPTVPCKHARDKRTKRHTGTAALQSF